MSAYLLRRIGTSLIVLVGISIFMYLLLHEVSVPGQVALGLRATRADRLVEPAERLRPSGASSST